MVPRQMSLWQFASVKDGPRNLPRKFGQNWVSNSWDISNVDKCRQDKCCLDKCCLDKWQCYNCNLFNMVTGLSLKFGQDQLAQLQLKLWGHRVSVGWVGGLGGVCKVIFVSNPTYVELELSWVLALTIALFVLQFISDGPPKSQLFNF